MTQYPWRAGLIDIGTIVWYSIWWVKRRLGWMMIVQPIVGALGFGSNDERELARS